jgi:hypothetical protein
VKRSSKSDDDLREARLDEIRDTVERFTFGLAMLLAGQDEDLADCTSADLSHRLRAAVEPFLATGDALKPDFGAYGQLRVEGDLCATEPVSALFEFEDRSRRESFDGRRQAAPRRRIRLDMRLTLEPCRVSDCTVHVTAAAP